MARKRKRSYKILWALLVLIALPIGFNAMSVFMKKRYTSEMRLMVDETTQTTQEASNPIAGILDIQNGARPRSPQTQLDVLTGSVVMGDALKMANDRLPDKVRLAGREDELYENLVRRLQVDNELGSDVLSVKVTDDDPDVSAELANDIGLAYIDYVKRTNKEAGTLLSDQVKARIDPLRAKLNDIDKKIGEIKEKTNIYDVAAAEANIGSTKEAADRNLAAAQAQYEGSKAQLAVSEAQMKGIPEYVQAASHTQINPLVVSLQQSLATERVQLAQLQAQYQDNFPTVREEKHKIADLEKQLKGAKQSVDSGTDKTINPIYQSQLTMVTQLRGQVQGFAGQYAAAKTEQQRASQSLAAIPKAEQVLQGLIRERAVTEQTYTMLASWQSSIQTNSSARQPTIQIVSTALPPSGPSYPDHKLLTMAGLAIGVFLAVLIMMPRPAMVSEVPEKVVPESHPSISLNGHAKPELLGGLEKEKPLERPADKPVAEEPPRTFAQAIQKATHPNTLSEQEFDALGALPAKKRSSKSA